MANKLPNISLVCFTGTSKLGKILENKIKRLGGTLVPIEEIERSGTDTVVITDLPRKHQLRYVQTRIRDRVSELCRQETTQKKRRKLDALVEDKDMLTLASYVNVGWIQRINKDLDPSHFTKDCLGEFAFVEDEAESSAAVQTDTKEGNAEALAPSPPLTVSLTDTRKTRTVPAFGLGTMPLAIDYPDPDKRPREGDAIAIIHKAVELGCRFFDTADTYSPDHKDLHFCERLVARALRQLPDKLQSKRQEIVVATKGGMVRINAQSNGWRGRKMTAAAVRSCVTSSLAAIQEEDPSVKSIPLWQLHHADASKPKLFLETLAEMKTLWEEGLVEQIGLCNATVPQIDAALKAGIPLVSVQNNYSLWDRAAEKELPSTAAKSSKKGVLQKCTDHGLVFIPYGVFGGTASRKGAKDLEADFPQLVEMAENKKVSPHALVLAYMKQKWDCILHIPGLRTPAHLDGALVGPTRMPSFSDSELNVLDTMRPVRRKR